jgi:hypothetical protein
VERIRHGCQCCCCFSCLCSHRKRGLSPATARRASRLRSCCSSWPTRQRSCHALAAQPGELQRSTHGPSTQRSGRPPAAMLSPPCPRPWSASVRLGSRRLTSSATPGDIAAQCAEQGGRIRRSRVSPNDLHLYGPRDLGTAAADDVAAGPHLARHRCAELLPTPTRLLWLLLGSTAPLSTPGCPFHFYPRDPRDRAGMISSGSFQPWQHSRNDPRWWPNYSRITRTPALRAYTQCARISAASGGLSTRISGFPLPVCWRRCGSGSCARARASSPQRGPRIRGALVARVSRGIPQPREPQRFEALGCGGSLAATASAAPLFACAADHRSLSEKHRSQGSSS